MPTAERDRRAPARTALVAGLVTAAAGLVAFLPWRWAPGLGLPAAVLLTVGAVTAGFTATMLRAR